MFYLNLFYKTEQGVGSSPIAIAIGKLKEGVPGEPCEDDLMLSTRVESFSSNKFFNCLESNLEMQCSTPTHKDDSAEGTTTLMLIHKE